MNLLDPQVLAFALVAMAYDYCMSREYMLMLAPGVLQRPGANEQILERLVAYGAALLRDEIERRGPRSRSASQGRRTDTAPRAGAGGNLHRMGLRGRRTCVHLRRQGGRHRLVLGRRRRQRDLGHAG